MKTQEILSLVNAIVGSHGVSLQTDPDVRKLIDGLEQQLRYEAAASTKCLDATRTVTAMLKALKKNDGRRALHYAWIDSHDRQCVCDGFRAYRFTTGNHLPLEQRPDYAGDPIDLDKVIPDAMPHDYKPIPLPDAKDVKAFVSVERAKTGRGRKAPTPLWDFGKNLPVVNAEYLLDLLAVFPDATEIFCKTPCGYISPMYLRTERGDAALLPVRTEAKKDEAAEEAAKQSEQIKANRAERSRIMDAYNAAVKDDPEYAMQPDAFEKLVSVLDAAA